jgi:hypothetical protein
MTIENYHSLKIIEKIGNPHADSHANPIKIIKGFTHV